MSREWASGGATVGAEDLLVRGPELHNLSGCADGVRREALHVFSVVSFTRHGYRLIFRETAPSFNTRCGSASLGETYAAVAQYIFGDWQESGKVMGLAPYGDPERCGPTLLEEGPDGLLRFSAGWKKGSSG